VEKGHVSGARIPRRRRLAVVGCHAEHTVGGRNALAPKAHLQIAHAAAGSARARRIAAADAEHEIAGQHAGWPAEVDERDGALVGIDGEEALRGG
jgi:hypothetical protein